jgi:hypothetical protein
MGLLLTGILIALKLTGEIGIAWVFCFIPLLISIALHAFVIVCIAWSHNAKFFRKR